MSRPLSSESVFRAVAHPIRRQIVEMLRKGDRPAGEVSEAFRTTRNNISQHLRVLRHAGLISYKRRGTQFIYHLNREPLQQLALWLKSVL